MKCTAIASRDRLASVAMKVRNTPKGALAQRSAVVVIKARAQQKTQTNKKRRGREIETAQITKTALYKEITKKRGRSRAQRGKRKMMAQHLKIH